MTAAPYPLERRNRLTLFSLIALTTLISLLVVGVIGAFWSVGRLPAAYQVRACFNSSASGRVKVSAWWLSPQVKDAPRWAYVAVTYPSCATLPWLPFLPQSGHAHWL
jgi:hypothetical protein